MNRTSIACGSVGIAVLSALFLSRGQGALPAAVPAAEVKKEPNTLRTSGSATVRIKPDLARVFFGVQTMAATVKTARTENNGAVRKIMTALAGLKIPDLKTKTTDVHAEILLGQVDGAKLPPISGYRISTTFTVLVQEEDPLQLGVLAGRILDAALENGANIVQQIVFLSKDGTTAARRKALTQAVEDAIANAKALAAGAHKDKIDTVSIDGQPHYREQPTFNNGMQNSIVVRGGDSEGSLVVGDLEVICNVNISCTY